MARRRECVVATEALTDSPPPPSSKKQRRTAARASSSVHDDVPPSACRPAATDSTGAQSHRQLEETTAELLGAIRKLYAGIRDAANVDGVAPLSREEWVSAYTDSDHERMQVYAAVRRALHDIVLESCKCLGSLCGKRLLEEYSRCWNDVLAVGRHVKNLARYAHRTWIQRFTNSSDSDPVRPLDELMQFLFKRELMAIIPPLVDDVLDVIDLSRRHGHVDFSVIKTVTFSLVVLGKIDPVKGGERREGGLELYCQEFERKFVQRTAAFFSRESGELVRQLSVPDFMRKADAWLKEELTRARSFVHPGTEELFLSTLEKVLVEQHKDVLQADAERMIREGHGEDLRLLYDLLLRVDGDGLQPVVGDFHRFCLEEGSATVQSYEQRSASSERRELELTVGLVNALIALLSRRVAMVARCFGVSRRFLDAVQNAFQQVLNAPRAFHGRSMAVVLARYVDHYMRGGRASGSGEDAERHLEQLLELLKLLHDKDVFLDTFRTQLSLRLLLSERGDVRGGGADGFELERAFIAKLRATPHVDPQHASRLVNMLHDADSSRVSVFTVRADGDANMSAAAAGGGGDSGARAEPAARGGVVLVSVKVLNALVWPIGVAPSVRGVHLGMPFEAAVEAFEKSYRERTSSRTLSWAHEYSRAVVLAHVPQQRPARYVVHCRAIQAAALLLFNDADERGEAELAEALSLPVDDLGRQLRPLPMLKRVEERGGGGGGDAPRWELHTGFSAGRRALARVIVPPTELSERHSPPRGEGGGGAPSRAVNADRTYEIDAALVRIMKARRMLSQQALLLELVQQVQRFFSPDFKLIKARLVSLLDRELILRDDADPNVYWYNA